MDRREEIALVRPPRASSSDGESAILKLTGGPALHSGTGRYLYTARRQKMNAAGTLSDASTTNAKVWFANVTGELPETSIIGVYVPAVYLGWKDGNYQVWIAAVGLPGTFDLVEAPAV